MRVVLLSTLLSDLWKAFRTCLGLGRRESPRERQSPSVSMLVLSLPVQQWALKIHESFVVQQHSIIRSRDDIHVFYVPSYKKVLNEGVRYVMTKR